MADKTHIQWTDATWNPWQGCHHVSPGCTNCYMFSEKQRYSQNPDVVVRSKPPTFNLPLKLQGPQRVFTCSWSDFFIKEADPWRDEAWEIIRNTPHLTYQILTKRIERAASRLPWGNGAPWANVWLGVSVEDQPTADRRIPLLLETPAAVRWISAEPLLSPINLGGWLNSYQRSSTVRPVEHGLKWVVVGGESGPRARPCNLEWIRAIRDQCQAAGVATFCKQLGSVWARSNSTDSKGGNWNDWPSDLRIRQYHGTING